MDQARRFRAGVDAEGTRGRSPSDRGRLGAQVRRVGAAPKSLAGRRVPKISSSVLDAAFARLPGTRPVQCNVNELVLDLCIPAFQFNDVSKIVSLHPISDTKYFS